MIDWFHPSVLFVFGAFVIPFLRGKVQQGFLMLIPILAVGGLALGFLASRANANGGSSEAPAE